MDHLLQQMSNVMQAQQEMQLQARQQHDKEMTAMRKLIEKKGPSTATEKVRITPYKDGEDIEDFLDTFERTIVLQERAQEEWVKDQIPLLQGKARAACATIEDTIMSRRGY